MVRTKVDRPTLGSFDGKFVTPASTMKCNGCERETPPKAIIAARTRAAPGARDRLRSGVPYRCQGHRSRTAIRTTCAAPSGPSAGLSAANWLTMFCRLRPASIRPQISRPWSSATWLPLLSPRPAALMSARNARRPHPGPGPGAAPLGASRCRSGVRSRVGPQTHGGQSGQAHYRCPSRPTVRPP